MLTRYTYPIVCSLLIILSCQHPVEAPPAVMAVLEKAGSNRNTFEKVIRHYREAPADSLKLKAAYFLIEKMVGLVTLDTNSVAQNDIYFNAISDLWNQKNRRLEAFEVSNLIDSVNAAEALTPRPKPASFLPDLSVVTPDLLIDNIDQSFAEWNTRPFSQKISFEDFCEYILPYRSSDTYAGGMKTHFQNKYQDALRRVHNPSDLYEVADTLLADTYSGYREDFQTFRKNPYLLPVKFSSLLNAKIGECRDMNTLRVNILRSFGIPAAVDGIPGWGNTGGKHFWYRIINRKKKNEPVLNQQDPFIRSKIALQFYSREVLVEKKELPRNVTIQYTKFLAKVFRDCFSKQPGSLAAINVEHYPLPEYFRSDRLMDVTNEYVKCADIEMPLKRTAHQTQPYIYLCTFDNADWNIVAWGNAKDSTATFSNMGVNVVYLPVWYENGNIIPAGSPFLLGQDGSLQYFISDTAMREKQTYPMKWPYRAHMANYARSAQGARFQLANNPDFSDSVAVHTIDALPFYGTDVSIHQTNKYRYLIFRFAGMPQAQIAELEYWGLNNEGKEVKLKGTLTGNKGSGDTSPGDAFDNDMLSYFSADKNAEPFLAVDLGANNLSRLTRIRYMPRNDDNVISTAKKYTLFYWKDGWQSLGERSPVAERQVTFDNVPRHALLLLKDNMGGAENRIFSYDEGRQFFW